MDMLLEFVIQYGYLALYGILALGLIVLPLPDETLVVFVGSLTSFGHLSYFASVLVAFAGKMTGMLIGYYLGNKFGKPFLFRYGRWMFLNPARLKKAEKWFARHGVWAVGIGYFIPGIRNLTCYLAGISKIKLWRYIVFASCGALVWCITFVSLGYFIGDNWSNVLIIMHKYTREAIAATMLASSVVLLVVIIYRRRVIRKR